MKKNMKEQERGATENLSILKKKRIGMADDLTRSGSERNVPGREPFMNTFDGEEEEIDVINPQD